MGLLIFSYLHKILFGCVYGWALIAIRHKCGFALRFFDVGSKKFLEARFAKQLLYGGYTQNFFLVGVKACTLNGGDNSFTCVLATGMIFDQLPASSFLTDDGLLESVLFDVIRPCGQCIDLAENVDNLFIIEKWGRREFIAGKS